MSSKDTFPIYLMTSFPKGYVCKQCNQNVSQISGDLFCMDCEVELFPERFFPCVCCRLPVNTPSMCMNCHFGILQKLVGVMPTIVGSKEDNEWVRKRGVADNYSVESCARGDFIKSHTDPTHCSNGDILPPAKELQHVYPDSRFPLRCKGWPGFYMGNGVWKKLDYLPTLDAYGVVVPLDELD